MNPTEEEIQDALAEVPVAEVEPAVAPEDSHTPGAAPSAPSAPFTRDDAKEFARELAAGFGSLRVEGVPNQRQRELTTREKIAQFTPEQRAEFEARLATGGAAAAMELMDMVTRDNLREFEARATPMVASTGELLIDSYKARKAMEDRYFKQVAPYFDKRTKNVDRIALVQADESYRRMQLDTLYDAASGDFFRTVQNKPTAQPTSRPPVIGGGGRAAAPPQGNRPNIKPGVFEDEGVKALIAMLKSRKNPGGAPPGLISDEDLAELASTSEEWL